MGLVFFSETDDGYVFASSVSNVFPLMRSVFLTKLVVPVKVPPDKIVQLYLTANERRVLRVIARQPSSCAARTQAKVLLLCDRVSREDGEVSYTDIARLADTTAANVDRMCQAFRHHGLQSLLPGMA